MLYINGSAVDTQPITLTPQDVVGENTWLGKSQYVADPAFNGKIDEAAVFDRTLKASEIAGIYSTGWNSSSGKVLALHLDENAATHGATLADVSGQGNHGTLYTFGSSKFATAPAATAHGGQIDLFARTRDDHLGHALYDGSTWTDWVNYDGLPVGAIYPIDAWTAQPPGNDAIENWLLDIETGHFTGDGREQIVLAYRSPDGIRIDLYDMKDGFRPVKVAELENPINDGWVPKIATGDVTVSNEDQNASIGVDEIGLVYILGDRPNPYEPRNEEYQFEVFQLQENSNGQYLGSFYTSGHRVGAGKYFAGTLKIAAGDIITEETPSGNDEFVVVSDWWWRGSYHDLITDLILYDSDDNNTHIHNLERKTIYATDNKHEHYVSTGLGLAVGDVNGPQPGYGIDEIVLTWPRFWEGHGDGGDWPDLYRDLLVFSYDKDLIRTESKYEIPIYSRYSFLDTLAVGDLDQDLKDEIVMASHQNGQDGSTGYYLDVYEYGTLSTGPIVHQPLARGSAYNLAMGDFTGESLHVGPPTYRLESQVGGLIALINEPPKHFDTLDGVDYDINSTDSGTYASYENEQSQSTEMSLQVTRDWGLASGLEVTAGDPEGTHVTTSIGNTYGEHFEHTTTAFNEITFGSSIIASHDDLADYSRTDYQVWEYPIYNDLGNTAAGYITVVFPQPVGNNQGTVEAFTPGSTCDFWYQPNHEINNVWSYPMDVTRFTDFDNDKGALNQIQVLTLGGVEGDFWTSWSDVATENQASAVNLGVSTGVEAQVGGDKIPIIGYRIPWSVKANFEASYDQGTLSTQAVVGSEATEVHAHFNPISSTASYEVTPYLYWSQDGYLVLDYVTNPNVGTSFWSQYDKADPAFIRPWSDGHCGTDRADFSKEVAVTPSFVSNGQTITATAMVRNFSNVSINNVQVRFYQGDPAQGGLQIGSDQVIATLGPRGRNKVSVQAPLYGSGEQRIYAVIYLDQQLTEMHTENNKAYGIVMMGASDYVDPGQAIQRPYVPMTYTGAISIAAYTPPGNTTETTRFELKGSSLSVPSVVGEPFELLAYQGSSGGWDTPINDFDLKPQADDPPAVIAIAYDDADIAGMDEANLCLFRLSTNGWKEATCAGYAIERFPEDNLIAVPVCQAGTFVLSAETPGSFTFLPLVLRNVP